jgi:hypothetical protein
MFVIGRSCKKVSYHLSKTSMFNSASVGIFTIASLDIPAIHSRGHHILPTSTLWFLYGDIWKTICEEPTPHPMSDELKDEISSVFIRISADALSRTVGNSGCRLQIVFGAAGSHTEYVLHEWTTVKRLLR